MISLLLLLSAAGAVSERPPRMTLSVNPPAVCADPRPSSYPNFDLLVRNQGTKEARILEVRGFALDRGGNLIERRILWQQALAVLGDAQTVGPGDTNIIFNPFSFRHGAKATALRYEIDLSGEAAPLSVVIALSDCTPRLRFELPIRGRLLVYDGHDFLSHHRRGRYLGSGARALGLTDNFQRFGTDLVVIDAQGRMFKNDGKQDADWFGWGEPVRAVASGVVAEVHDGQPDNIVVGNLDQYKVSASPTNPLASYGNFVLIDHGRGEFSIVGHLKNGSVAVHKGQHVRAGEMVARVGNSGASGGVHTHFERRTGPGIAKMRSLPPYFTSFRFADGMQAAAASTVLDTGDVVISNR